MIRLEKVYYLSTRDDPSAIPTGDFDREGRHYTLLDVLKNDLSETDSKDYMAYLQGANQICLGLLPVVRGKILFDKPRLIQPVQHIQHIADEPLRGVRRQLRRWHVLRLDQPIQPCQQRFGFCQVGKYQVMM